MPEDQCKTMDMWTPYKELLNVVQAVVSHGNTEVPPKFLELLKKHKQNFLNLLKNPPKNSKHREELNKGSTDGITLPEVGHQVLSKDLVDEALILSDMYNLNEFMSLDLLCTAQAQMPYHPGLTRGLVAIILYYDGRKSLVKALKELVLSRKGFTFSSGAYEEVSNYLTEYTNELMESGIVERILELIETLDLSKEIELLQQNRALGGPKHHKLIVDLFSSIKQTLAETVFFWATQCSLPKDSTLRLLKLLKKTKLEEESHGAIDNVTLGLQMSLLAALDLSLLQRSEDREVSVQEHPLICDKTFIPTLMKELPASDGRWECTGLQALTNLAWALSLSTLKIAPQTLHPIELNEEDESMADSAIEMKVFEFLYTTFFENSLVFEEEFYLRRLHTLMTDFIVLMPLKVRELKNKGEESSRITQMYSQQGLEAPQNLSHHFEHLLLSVSKLYSKDPCNLELCLDYWCPQDNQVSYPYRSQPRQVSLFKFVRMAGELVPSLLFVPYLKMLCSLANSPQAARYAFAMLKQDGMNTTVSWDHFFISLNRYFTNLRQELPPTNDTVYRHRGFPKGITPQEIQGLHTVLSVIKTVAEQDELSRLSLCENPNWAPLTVLLGLVSCSVPIILKADLLNALAALSKTPSTAITLWHNLEASQIITTIPSTSSYIPRGVKTELDEIESRNEEFPLTRALLKLLDVLTDIPTPRLLGSGTRSPGFDPYLHFIVDCVFLKFNHRSYKYPEEKWKIAESCLNLLVKLLKQYEPQPEDLFGRRVEVEGGVTAQVNPPPGYHLMVNLNNKSELLRLVLYLIDESVHLLDTYTIFPGKEALESSSLCCLELIDITLKLQSKFITLVTISGVAMLLAGLSKLLMDTNPRSGKPDHLLNITKFVTYCTWLPRHAYHAVSILSLISTHPLTQSHLVCLFTSTPTLKTDIRHGFVECLEAPSADDDDNRPETDEDELSVQSKTKELILKWIHRSLNSPQPNIAHYLTGFDLNKDLSKMVFQQPGILQAPRTVLHSLLAILNISLKSRTGLQAFPIKPKILEAAYNLLYSLCSNVKTSEPVLRFLRSSNDFICRHVQYLPFKPSKCPSQRNQMAWLLKIVAIELKVCSAKNYQSQVESLVNLLVCDPTDEEVKWNDDETDTSYNPRILDPESAQSLTSSISAQKRNDQRFLRIINLISFTSETVDKPNWDHFDPVEVDNVLQQCETSVGHVRLIDVKRLYRLLMDEVSGMQRNSTTSQRHVILDEIKSVCVYAVAKNKLKNTTAATLHLIDAWRQLTEIIFAVTPNDVLQNDYRQELIIDTLHILLYKVVSSDTLVPEIGAAISGVVLLLLVYLRQCQAIERRDGKDEVTQQRNEQTGDVTITLTTLQAYSNTLRNILSGLLQWIVDSGAASQKLRANLYGSFLNYLYITCLECFDENNSEDDNRIRLPSGSEADHKKAILKMISNVGEGLAEALCHDCTGGHDVGRMLALSCLDVLIDLDPFTSWISYLSTRGYLQHLIDGLLESDEQLVELCVNQRVATLKPLYMYESKLVLLSRIASTHEGAILLIEHNAVNCLASMKVFDVQTRSTTENKNDFLPSTSERFQQILFPALNLLDSIITSLGIENRSSNEVVVHFLLCHGDMVSSVLRTANPRASLGNLTEVARLTSIIARSADIGPFEEAVQFFDVNMRHGAHSPYLLRTLMLDLVPRFVITDDVILDIWENNSLSSKAESPIFFDTKADDKIERVLCLFEIMSNLTIYVRTALSSKDRVDYRATEPVFWPGLTDQQTADGRSGGRGNTETPLLGYTVQQLVECVNHYHKEKTTTARLMRKKNSVQSMTTTELSQLLLSAKETNTQAENRYIVSKMIKTRLEQKTLELERCSFLIDNCLYIVWSHLDFFMLRALPKPKQGLGYDAIMNKLSTPLSSRESTLMNVTAQDISSLKVGLVSIFNDNFSKKLIECKESETSADKNFVEALLRRIKRLIQFVPVK